MRGGFDINSNTSMTAMPTSSLFRTARPVAPVLLCALATLMFFSFSQALAQGDKDVNPALAATFQALIDDMQTSGTGVVGLAAAVAMPDGGRWEGAAGNSAVGVPLEPGMLQGIGSITKTYVATLILKLEEEGRLSIDDPLHRWLPAYAHVDSVITIRQLLNHTSGIFNYLENQAVNDSLFLDFTRTWTPEQLLTYFVKPRNFAPGKGWHYSNTNYVLLGMIAEKVTGRPVEVEIRERLLAPNRLTDTFFPNYETLEGDVADPWSDATGDQVPDNIVGIPREGLHSLAWAAGAMFSTPKDLVNWGRALYGGTVLSSESLEKMLAFRTVQFGACDGYGLGIMRFKVSGRTVYGHGGNVLGYSSLLLYSPQDRVTVALIVNETTQVTSAGLYLMATAISNAVSSVQNADHTDRGFSAVAARRNYAGKAITMDYMLGEPGTVRATLHDLLGNEVAAITTDYLMAGPHTLHLGTSDLPHGIYFYRLANGAHMVSGKITL